MQLNTSNLHFLHLEQLHIGLIPGTKISFFMKHKEKSPNRWISVPEVEDPPHISPEIVFLSRVEGHFHHLHHLPPIIVVVIIVITT